jgi:hypothetical protein
VSGYCLSPLYFGPPQPAIAAQRARQQNVEVSFLIALAVSRR